MRKNLIYSIATACALLGASVCGFAQQEYAYPHSIDMQLGYIGTPLTVKGDSYNAHGMSDGTVFDLRYTGYITPHFGLFAEFGFAGTDLNNERYFRVVNRADGNKYRYDGYNDDLFSECPYNANYAPIFKVGFAYRLDCGQFSFRPRIGVGVTGYKFQDQDYERVYNDGGSDYVTLTMLSTRDYLVDDMNRDREPALILNASAQMTYTFFDHFYLSAEVGLDAIPEQVTFQKTVSSSRASSQSYTYTQSIPDMVSVKFGIGWNIGWNRNVRRGGLPSGIHPIPRRY